MAGYLSGPAGDKRPTRLPRDSMSLLARALRRRKRVSASHRDVSQLPAKGRKPRNGNWFVPSDHLRAPVQLPVGDASPRAPLADHLQARPRLVRPPTRPPRGSARVAARGWGEGETGDMHPVGLQGGVLRQGTHMHRDSVSRNVSPLSRSGSSVGNRHSRVARSLGGPWLEHLGKGGVSWE